MNNMRHYPSHIRSAEETSRIMEAEHSAGIKGADTGAFHPGGNINGDIASGWRADWTDLTRVRQERLENRFRLKRCAQTFIMRMENSWASLTGRRSGFEATATFWTKHLHLQSKVWTHLLISLFFVLFFNFHDCLSCRRPRVCKAAFKAKGGSSQGSK